MRVLMVCLALALVVSGQPSAEVYARRRADLRQALQNATIVLFGQTEKDAGLSGFAQEPNFYYLTGWNEPAAVLLLDPEREVLFLPSKDAEAEKWTGPKASPGDPDIARVTGFNQVVASERLERELQHSLERYTRIYTLKARPESARLEALAPLREIVDAALAIARLRMTKSPEEIALIQRATDVSMEMHRAAWRRAAPGVAEYQVAGTMAGLMMDQGCERFAYPPIVGSGPNALALHYSRNRRRMDGGELLLVDAAAECSGYASDITRTIPVGGRFSQRQREIYEIVLGAQKAAIAAVKPGMTLGRTTPNSLFQVALSYINEHGKDSHGNPLGKYFVHGLGHHVGLEVHDANDAAAPLAPGMVITIEPGLYIPDENIGVRIEDVVLVTESGSRVLSEALPKSPKDMEKAVTRATGR